MITPKFKLSQDARHLNILIDAPHCSLKDLDVAIDDNVFLFVCKPYYLRLHLPGNLKEDISDSTYSFNSTSSQFKFHCEKETPGQDFEDLHIISKFLVNQVDASYNDGTPKVEIMSDETDVDMEFSSVETQYGFGFALRAHKDFVQISSQFDEVFEIDPCKVSILERRKLRLQLEQGKFNSEHYGADFLEDNEINEIIALKSPWCDPQPFSFTDREEYFMRNNITCKEHSLTEKQLNYVYNGLIDILFAYCYDRRTMFYDESIESGWTIIKLAATFSWLDAFETPKEAVTSVFRRSVIYPLYRNFKLSEKVFEDVKQLICLDKGYLLKCFIEMYFIFLKGDCCRYIINNLFIKDYISFVVYRDTATWKSFTDKVLSIKIEKPDLGLNLLQIEAEYKIAEKLTSMDIQSDSGEDSDDSSEDSSEDSDTTLSESSE